MRSKKSFLLNSFSLKNKEKLNKNFNDDSLDNFDKELINKRDYFKLYENDEDIFEHYRTIENEKKINKIHKFNKNKNYNNYNKDNNKDNFDDDNKNSKKKFSKIGQNIINNNNNNSNIRKKNFLFNQYTNYYNPTLIKYCKKAVYDLRKDLPNYKEIINKINNEFNINNNYNNNYSMTIENKNNISNINSNFKNISYCETTVPTETNNIKNNSSNVNNISIDSDSDKENNKETINNNNDNNNNENNNNNINNSQLIQPISKAKSSVIRKSIIAAPSQEQLRLQKMKIRRKNILLSAIRYLSYNGFSLQKFLYNKVLPSKPYELKNSEEFIESVKFNNLEKVKSAIMKDKNYLYQYDYNKQTGFHWAAKLGYDEMLRFMLQNSEACNLYDNKMRTPIYLAALFNQRKCIEALMEFNGNAYICDLDGKKPIDVCTNQKCKELLMMYVENNNLWKSLNKKLKEKK